MYHSRIPIDSTQLQKTPLNKQLFSQLIKEQVINFSRNPYEHLFPSESWSWSDSEEESDSVYSDKFSLQSPVSPGSLSSSNSDLSCNDCDSIELNSSELRPDSESCELTQKLNVALQRIKQLEDKQDEMLRLHASMTALVSGLIGVVSTGISGQSVHRAPSQPRSFLTPEVNTESSSQPPSSPPSKAAIKRKEDDRKERRKQQQMQIDKLVAFIDRRAEYYNRNKSIPIKRPYPRVDWAKVNIHTKRNLPQPSQLPVHGCPQDPLIYPDAPDPKGRVMEYYSVTSKCNITGCEHKPCIPPSGCTTTTHPNRFSKEGSFTAISRDEKEVLLTNVYHPLKTTWAPFGTAKGFPTNLGVVAMPSDPVGGYLYTEDQGWVLYATPR